MSEISRHKNDISRCNSKKADINKKITAKTGDLHRYQLQLIKEQENDQKKELLHRRNLKKNN